MQDFQIPDRNGRQVVFTGVLLAKGSSDDGKVMRWSEIELYRTQAGKYVIHTIGQSSVFHQASSICSRDAQPLSLEELSKDRLGQLSSCRRCRPALAGDVLMEQPRHAVIVADEARGVVNQLWSKDEDGTHFMTKLNERVLEQASDSDEQLRDAWLVRSL